MCSSKTVSPQWLSGKEFACTAGDLSLIPALGRSPGEGNDYTLQYSCLENSHGQRSLMGYSPWGCRELDVTEHTHKNCYYLKKWTIIFKNVCFLFAISCCPDIVNFCPCLLYWVHFSSVAQSCLTLCNPMDCSRPGFPVHYQLPELTQTHVH